MITRNIRLGRLCCAVTLACLFLPSFLPVQAYVTIWGGPEKTPGEHYQISPGWGIKPSVMVGDGVAAVTLSVEDDAGSLLRNDAVRWDAFGAAPTAMGNLGTELTGFTTCSVMAVDEFGIMVGYANRYDVLGNGQGYRAVRWGASGTPTELGHMGLSSGGMTFSIAHAVNVAGYAVGQARLYDVSGHALGDRPVRWDPSGTATELGNLGTKPNGDLGPNSAALDINNAGTAVGSVYVYDDSGPFPRICAVRWDTGTSTATELGNLGVDTDGHARSEAWAINAAGITVGTSDKFDAAGKPKGERAVRWDASGTAVTELGTLGTNSGGSTISRVAAINDAGAIVGFARKFGDSDVELGERAVRWDAGGTAATELGILGTDANGNANSHAVAINASGTAVGHAQKYDTSGNDLGMVAVMWGADALAIDLNTLIDPTCGWILTDASDISDTGWITGIGRFDPDGPGGQDAYSRPWLMQVTVIPEPAGVVLLLVGAAAAIARQKASR